MEVICLIFGNFIEMMAALRKKRCLSYTPTIRGWSHTAHMASNCTQSHPDQNMYKGRVILRRCAI